ncbi:hypothetical protein [uncultured Tenacibaculum sp.]|uniref:hypothetical protein n=1 Tax=uncultured Tenacibaculum sp. TaxID=174713 RepID=UPI002619C408|nr:hypothetical protein [uncultured Tenacibaculum sp.]
MEYKVTNIDIAKNPLIKELLITYVKARYEEEAIINHDILQQEFDCLVKNNQLEDLLLAEYIVTSLQY